MIGYTGSPVIKYKNSSGTSFTINLPTPKKGGRSEKYDDSETKSFTNINGKRIKGKKRERFIGEYSFTDVSDGTLTELYDMYNYTRKVRFYPYSDLNKFHICHIQINKLRDTGYIQISDLKIKVTSINYVNERFTNFDAKYSGFLQSNYLAIGV